MKKIYEAWDDERNGHITFASLAGIAEDRVRGLLSTNAKFMFRVEAATFEEAMAIRNMKLGWGPYVPQGEPRECPRDCGAMYYPQGSGECPNCGKIC